MNELPDTDLERAVLDGPAPSGLGHRVAVRLLIPLLLLLLATILVFFVFFSGAVVVGESMFPTLHNADYLLVTRGGFYPKRGDIVVTDVVEGQGPVELVKRVIGLPGDVVEIRGDVAYVNGQQEPNRGQVVLPQFSESRPPLTVPAGSIYVMGDNRADSLDSRQMGPVPLAGLKGRATSVFAPIYRIHVLR